MELAAYLEEDMEKEAMMKGHGKGAMEYMKDVAKVVIFDG